MSAFDCIERLTLTSLPLADLRYCFVNEKKNPFKADGTRASTNSYSDFVSLEDLASADSIDHWAGIGISVQASDVVAIDLDHCVSIPRDSSTINDQALDIINMFKAFSYVEFSFSGTGIRILLRSEEVSPYKERYYIKNSDKGVEYYQTKFDNIASNRFVTVTGNCIIDNDISIKSDHRDIIEAFLNKYMQHHASKPYVSLLNEERDDRTVDELMKIVKREYFTNFEFQEDWFHDGIHPTTAEHDESERDFRIIKHLAEKVTTDREKVRLLFEQSPFFKTKDKSHIKKWEYCSHRYFNWQFDHIVSKK